MSYSTIKTIHSNDNLLTIDKYLEKRAQCCKGGTKTNIITDEYDNKLYIINGVPFNKDGYLHTKHGQSIYRLSYCDAIEKFKTKNIKEIKCIFNETLYVNDHIINLFKSAIREFYCKGHNFYLFKTIKQKLIKKKKYNYMEIYHIFIFICNKIVYSNIKFMKFFENIGINSYYELLNMHFTTEEVNIKFCSYINKYLDDNIIKFLLGHDIDIKPSLIESHIDDFDMLKKNNIDVLVPSLKIDKIYNSNTLSKSFIECIINYILNIY